LTAEAGRWARLAKDGNIGTEQHGGPHRLRFGLRRALESRKLGLLIVRDDAARRRQPHAAFRADLVERTIERADSARVASDKTGGRRWP
jgi:hypothetical protein